MKNPLKEKSYEFALHIVQLVKELQKEKKEFVISKTDFSNKLSIALKEANETEYWLKLLTESNYIKRSTFISLQIQCKELIAMLVSSVKTSASI